MVDPSDAPEAREAVSITTAIAACAGLVAAWLAAGSTGLLNDPLRIILTYLALAVAVLLGRGTGTMSRWLIAAVVVVACLPLVMSVPPLHELFIATAVMGLLAAGAGGSRRVVLATCSYAILALAVFRLACASIPLVWQLADRLGGVLGHLAGWVAGEPLHVGATFAGIDFLVLMAALYTAWLLSTERPRMARAIVAACAILGGHLVYLVVLARAQDLVDLLPTAPDPTFDHPYTPPDWRWSPSVAQLLPWNLPALAVVIHVAIASIMLRWARWKSETDSEVAEGWHGSKGSNGRRRWVMVFGPLTLAVLLPLVSTLSLGRSDLSGKKIVANLNGRLNWERPQHDRYGQQSAGLFGMLPPLVKSLGGRLRLSPELSEEDLAEADVLLLIHPEGPIAESVRKRVWNFVRDGGALLVVAEPYLREGDTYSAANELLRTTAVTVRRDVAISETGRWQQACDLMTHPVVSAVADDPENYFSDAGCSMKLGWAARPLVIGRWGWSDPGSDAVLTGVYQRERGERLGDLVLAAEQRYGAGMVVVLGDDHVLTNEGSVRGYTLTARLLAYLANRRGSPLALWRQLLALACCFGLLILTMWKCVPQRLFLTALLLVVSWTACSESTRRSTRIILDGTAGQTDRLGTRSNLAYIDASHLEAYVDTPWVFDGIEGLSLTLMRNGFLTATLPEVTEERLSKAAILVSIAPARRFTDDERAAVRGFVENGGVLICTVGAEQASASAPLLEDFHLRVPASPVPSVGDWHEPEPIGRIRSLFLNAQDYGLGDYRVGVRFYAAWPVEVRGGNADILVRAADNRPIVVSKRFGKGHVVVIGDTGFALNKNLEYIGGEAFEGDYENSHFWRWLISRVTDQAEWVPPPGEPPADNEMPDAGTLDESTQAADVLLPGLGEEVQP